MTKTDKHLRDILDGREKRAQIQNELLKRHRLPLISFSLNVPGRSKHSPMWSKVFREGLGAVREILIRNKMKIVFETVNQSASGDDAFIAADGNALEIKKMAVSLESGHPLGRLWDIDVFDAGGGLVGRETLGKEKRRCLICGDQVALCRRAGKHDVGEVIERMERICQSYFNDDPER